MRHFYLRPVPTAVLSVFATCALFPSYVNMPANAQANKRLQQTTVATKSNKVQEPRLALVIGNSEYKGNLLKNPVNDARAMATLLTKQGFTVVEKENLTQTEMLEAIRAFGAKLQATPGAVALFYFSGHGLQAAGQNWLVPLQHDIHSERDVPDMAVSAQRVLDQMTGGRLNIVILDACRDNPFISSTSKSLGKGLAKMDAPSGTLIAYATAPGKTADDGEGENGLYTQELLKQMRTPGLKIEDVFKKTRVQVKARSKGQQLPWEESSLENDFYFVPAHNKTDKTDNDKDTNDDKDNLLRPKTNPKDGAEMVWIPPGEFTMGSNNDFVNQKPAHTVRLTKGYWMYRKLVTVSQYEKFCKETGRPMPPEVVPNEKRIVNPGWLNKDHPMVNVSWYDAMAYCAWASVSLPTEAEWERAARGPQGFRYPWGNTFDAAMLWCSKLVNGDAERTCPVGVFPANGYGLYDMAGNVWEWCLDYYDEQFYSSPLAAQPNPQNTIGNDRTERAIRSSSWYFFNPNFFTASCRYGTPPDVKGSSGGFRCVLR